MNKQTTGRYELLDHTADAKFRAYGSTRDEVFAAAVQGLTAIAVDPNTIGTEKIRHVLVSAKSLDRLLFDMLDELLFLLDTEKFIAARAEALTIVEREGEFVLDATLHGDDAKKWSSNLKAVTYSEMIVREEPDGTWLIQAVIDI